MKDMKAVDYKILCELMKNSKLSDRQLAKKVGVSQPTVTRRRTMLEKDVIAEYTTIPVWEKLGYEVFAITLVKIRQSIGSEEKYNNTRGKALDWLKSQPNVIMAGACRGMGVDSFMISLHKSYSDYDDFMRSHRLKMGEFCEDIQYVLVNLVGKEIIKPLQLRCLTEIKSVQK
jgi:DNA-binding Lrp family transcriptional regulator